MPKAKYAKYPHWAGLTKDKGNSQTIQQAINATGASLVAAQAIITAADLATHALSPLLHPTIVRKTSDQTVNNSDVLVNDSQLFLPVLANEIWFVHVRMRVQTKDTPALKAAITCPAGGVVRAHQFFESYAMLEYYNAGNPMAFTNAGDTTDAQAIINILYVGGANAGNLQVQWAQQTANATDSKVLTNSYLIASRLL